jgi:hypothetical protein
MLDKSLLPCCSWMNWSTSRSLTFTRGSTSRSRTRVSSNWLRSSSRKLRQRDAVSRQASAQLGHFDLVLPRHVLLGLVHRQLVHLDAGFTRQLQLRPFR